METPFIKNRIVNSRKGIIMFVVIGAIVVLAVLVFSYNYLVMGKSNESKEILRHLRAEKCAQSVCRYIFAHLFSYLDDSYDLGTDSTTVGQNIRNIFFYNNNPDSLKDQLTKEFLDKIQYKNYASSLLDGTIGNDNYDCVVELGFLDMQPLNNLKAAKGIKNHILFLDGEKIGRLTLRVTVKIGRANAVWQETRPFKVVFPFPLPITKFTFYWKDGVSSSAGEEVPYSLNTVLINSENGDSANGKHPLLLNNGTSEKNITDDIWMRRGWIYIGGEDLYLNRAKGDKKYGQFYHSYSDKGDPLTLAFDFQAGGDHWSEHPYKNEQLGFRVAYWGFSDSLTKSSNQTWKTILQDDYEKHSPDSAANKVYWYSSCLQLFSNSVVMNGGSIDADNNFPTITRVIGNVNDRFLEMGYLLPVSSSDTLFAAVKGLDENEYGSFQKKGDSCESVDDYTIEKMLYCAPDYKSFDSEYEGAKVLQDYFYELPYKSGNASTIDYRKVMSKAKSQSFDVTYNVISQYSMNHDDISLPPDSLAPATSYLRFAPEAGKELDRGILPEQAMGMDIPTIGEAEDSNFGLSLRKCYEITGNSSSIQNVLRANFSNEDNSELNLKNLVYKLTSDGDEVVLDDVRTETAGTIYSDGHITVGASSSGDENTSNSPMMVLAGKNSITVDNSNSEIRAYLVALGDGGTIKASRADAPLIIRGGIAVKEFQPDNIPDKGGCLIYDEALDPTKDNIKKYIGVAIGPRGGDL